MIIAMADEGSHDIVANAPDPSGEAEETVVEVKQPITLSSTNSIDSEEDDSRSMHTKPSVAPPSPQRVPPPPPARRGSPSTSLKSSRSANSSKSTSRLGKYFGSLTENLASVRDNVLAVDSQAQAATLREESDQRRLRQARSIESLGENDWKSKYHALAQQRAETEADLLSQLTAMSTALHEQIREAARYKKESKSHITKLLDKLDRKQEKELALQQEKEDLTQELESCKAELAKAKEADSDASDDSCQEQETDANTARLIAYERENKYLTSKLEKSTEFATGLSDELDATRGKLEVALENKNLLRETHDQLARANETLAQTQSQLDASTKSNDELAQEKLRLETLLLQAQQEMQTQVSLLEKHQSQAIESKEKDLTKAKQELVALEEQFSKMRVKYEARITQLMNDNKILITKLKQSSESRDKEMTEIKTSHEQQLDLIQKKLAKANKVIEGWEEQFAAMRSEFEERQNTEVGTVKEREQELQKQVAHLNVQLMSAKADLETTKYQFVASNAELDTTNKQLASVIKELEATKNELEATQSKLHDCKAELEQSNKMVDTCRLELNTSNKELAQAKTELDTIHSELKKSNVDIENFQKELEASNNELESYKEALEVKLAQSAALRAQQERDYEARINLICEKLQTSQKEIDFYKKSMHDDDARQAEETAGLRVEKATLECQLQELKVDLESQLEEFQREKDDMNEHINKLIAQIESDESQQEVWERALEKTRAEKTLLEQEVKKFVAHMDKLQEEHSAEKAQHEESIKALNDKIALLIQENKTQSNEHQTLVGNLNKEIMDLKAAMDESAHKSVQESLEAKIKDLERQLAAALEHYRNYSKEHQNEVATLQAKIEKLKAKIDDEKLVASTRVKKAENKLFSTEETVISLAKRVDELELLVDSLEKQKKELEIELEKDKTPPEWPNVALTQAEEAQRTRHVRDLEEKVSDRNKTIQGLLKAAAIQDERMAELKAEKNRLSEKRQLNENSDDGETIQDLRAELEGVKEREAALSGEIESLLHQIQITREESEKLIDLQIKLDLAYNDIADLERSKSEQEEALRKMRETHVKVEHAQELEAKIQERNASILSLNTKVTEYENKVAELHMELESITNSEHVPPEEFKRVQEESQMFASQVVELDEEMESLKQKLEQQRRRNTALSDEVREMRSALVHKSDPSTKQVVELRRQVHDLEETNATLKHQLASLRKKPMSNDDEEFRITELEEHVEQLEISMAALKRENAKLQDSKESLLTAKLKRDVETAAAGGLKDIKAHEKIEALTAQVELLNKQLKAKEDLIIGLEDELDEMQAKYENEMDRQINGTQSKDSIDEMTSEIIDLKKQIATMERHERQVADLKIKLEESESERVKFEQATFEGFRKKMSEMKTLKEAAIDKLRKEIAICKAEKKEMQIDFMNQITELEGARNKIKSNLERRYEEREEVIRTLTEEVATLKKTNASISKELDQLRGNMNRVSTNRRDEVEEMQQELMDCTARVKEQERELSVLRDKLEETKLLSKEQVEKLQAKLDQAESSGSVKGTQAVKDQMQIETLQDNIQELKWRINSLTEENSRIRQKVTTLEAENVALAKSKSKNSDSVLKTSMLKDQIKSLTVRLQELEAKKSRPTFSPTRGASLSFSPDRNNSFDRLYPDGSFDSDSFASIR